MLLSWSMSFPPELVYSFFCALAEAFHAAKHITMNLISIWLQGFPQLEVDGEPSLDFAGSLCDKQLCRSLRDSGFLRRLLVWEPAASTTGQQKSNKAQTKFWHRMCKIMLIRLSPRNKNGNFFIPVSTYTFCESYGLSCKQSLNDQDLYLLPYLYSCSTAA